MPASLQHAWELLLRCGPAVIPVLFLAGMAILVLAERTLAHFGARSRFERLLGRVRRRILLNEIGQLQYQLAKSSRPLQQLTATYLDFLSDAELRKSILTREKSRYLMVLRKRISLLGVIGVIAPLAGLIGTLVLFGTPVDSGFADPSADGTAMLFAKLSTSLVPFGIGLATAIPCVIGYVAFSRSCDRIGTQMEWLISYLDEWTADLRKQMQVPDVAESPATPEEAEEQDEEREPQSSSRIDLGGESDMDMSEPDVLRADSMSGTGSGDSSEIPIRPMRRRRRS